MNRPALLHYLLCGIFSASGAIAYARAPETTPPPEHSATGPFQQIGSYFDRRQALHAEKLWFHLDKPYYAAGDSIWFKGYLVDAVDHHADTLSNFVNVDLADRTGKIILSKKIKRDAQGFSNNFVLPITFPAGEYTLRAYTGWMLNFDPAFFFQKNILIGNSISDQVKAEITYTNLDKTKKQAIIRFYDPEKTPYADVNVRYELFDRSGKRLSGAKQKTSVTGAVFAELPADSLCQGGRIDLLIDEEDLFYEGFFFIPEDSAAFAVQFFPEGGDLVAGQQQLVAFKGERPDGLPADVSGAVVTSRGDTVARFASEHDGMGMFLLCPQAGTEYRAETTGPSGRKATIPLSPVKTDGCAFAVTQTPSEIRYRILTGENCDSMLVVAHIRGMCIHVRRIDGNRTYGGWKTDSIPEGILHLVLLDKQLRPRSERLVFVSHPESRGNFTVTPDKQAYGKREKVRLRVALENRDGQPVTGADCSVSITDNRTVGQDTLADNILSNLLLSSDIRGYVHNPGYYFLNDAPKTRHYLDLVMRTNGWRRFDLSKITDTTQFRPAQPIERDLFIDGHVTWIMRKGAKNAPVLVMSMDKENTIKTVTETDKKGDFRVNGLDFNGTILFILYSETAKGLPMRSIRVNQYYPQPEFTRKNPFAEQGISIKKNMENYLENLKDSYYIEGGQKIYNLQEVIVKGFDAKRPRTTLNATVFDSTMLSHFKPVPLPQYMSGCYNQLAPLGTWRIPSYYNAYEGFTTWDLSYIKMEKKPNCITVEAFLKPLAKRQFTAKAVGAEICKMVGYAESVRFYNPVYDTPEKADNGKADNRTTLYWNPGLQFGPDGTAEIEFYTDDNKKAGFDVTIEGITPNGKIYRYSRPM